MNNLVFSPAYQLATAIRSRQVSSVEVLEAHLHQIAKHNPTLNAIVTLDEERARQRAKEADEAISQGVIWGPLHGIPVTIKDFFETQGLRTTCSYKPLANYIPQNDATSVARLRSAGAIILGKTNLPYLAQDFQTDSPLFGRTNNPWDLDRTPGGSTGGGAVAVSAGLSPLELGGDGGGSIRIPAHFCGVFGLKPTEHRVSTAGLILGLPGGIKPWRHQAVVGPLARCVEDLRLCLSVIEGPDEQEWEVPPAPQETVAQLNLSSLRFAWSDNFGGVPVTAETQEILEKLAITLEEQGCWVEYANPPEFDFEAACEIYGEIAGAEIIAAEPTHRRRQWWLLSWLLSQRFNPEPMVRGFSRAGALSMKRYAEALTRRDVLIQRMEQFLSNWDAWICPVTPGAAFRHHKTLKVFGSPFGGSIEVDDTTVPYWSWGTSYTSVFNLTGNPVVTIPVGFTKTGLPIGVQLVGRRWQDMRLLSVAEAVSQLTGSIAQKPLGY
ncbi:amidase [Trichocoleus sp. FACHB-90]|uniref:amidase n=1 Tax=Cyanophyceae TaxID=3028117 RepID=UPI0016875A3E|nr:amidase [Trichocoleus sp. FACHB-90]MBD1929966.1 amidase [Trichocoleus sp. FACHB-90]